MHKVLYGSEIFTHTDTYYFYEHRIYAPIVINDVKRATIRLSFENTLCSNLILILWQLFEQSFARPGKTGCHDDSSSSVMMFRNIHAGGKSQFGHQAISATVYA